jgi:hypothetical protein
VLSQDSANTTPFAPGKPT